MPTTSRSEMPRSVRTDPVTYVLTLEAREQDRMTAGADPRRGVELLQRALELDPMLGEAHASLGYAATFYDWDWRAAENAFQLAVELQGIAAYEALAGEVVVEVGVTGGPDLVELIAGDEVVARPMDMVIFRCAWRKPSTASQPILR